MGKSCIKFKRPEHIREAHLGELVAQLSPEQYISHYAPLDPRNR
jgi:hypothetical protein